MITESTKLLPVNPDGIPAFLKAQPYWTNWKVLFRGGKGRKVPTYGTQVLYGQYWETKGKPFVEVANTIPANGGLGFLLSLRHDLACIDIDNCAPEEERFQRILRLAPGAWCEYSPSGKGIHIWGRLPDKESYRLPERKTIGYSGKQYEWFATGRSVTMTGHHICGDRLPDLTQAVLYCESLRPKLAAPKYEIIPVDIPTEDILKKAFRKDKSLRDMYHNGHTWEDKSVQDFYFCRKLWFWLGGLGPAAIEQAFRSSAMFRSDKGAHYPELTIRNAGKRWNGECYGKNRQNKK